MTIAPCTRCLKLAIDGRIRSETVMPLPHGAWAPLSREANRRPQCFDCASAESMVRLNMAPGFVAARIAVGNDRQEQLRLPGVPMGLVSMGLVKRSKEGDFEKHAEWLKLHVEPLLPEEVE